jgi:2-polyprenyl-3-methyl-5-hydroxy-6-metoxy-1,4-benzoquinol methylase
MSPRYPIKASRYSSHGLITDYINEFNPQIILDLGCGTGELTSRYVSQGKKVYGIEIDSQDAEEARQKGIMVSIQSLDEASKFPPEEIGLVVAADILEHLQNPSTFLIHLRQQLPREAKVIVSIPNVANLFVRFSLLFGKFNYADRGILDRTHLRFFTRKTLLELFYSSGYEFKILNYTPIPIGEVIPSWVPQSITKASEKMMWGLTKFAPTLLGYQFIGEARSK